MDGVCFFPTPERAAHLTVAELRDLQFSTSKSRVLNWFIRASGFRAASVRKISIAIQSRYYGYTNEGSWDWHGWTVENFLLFGLGRPNLFPKADIGIQNAIKKLYNLEQKPTQEEMETYSKNWSPYLSYASLYLWRSVEKTE